MNFKTLYITLICLFTLNLAFAQTTENTDEYVFSFDSLKTKEKLHYNFEMGVGMGLSNQSGKAFSTYYSPSLSYQITPRFKINTGLFYINSSVSGLPVYADYKYELFSGNISEYNAYIGGQYQLTDKLSVGGSIFYDFTNYNSNNGLSDESLSKLNQLGYSANFKYEVAKGFTIEGELRVRDGKNYRPFNRGQAGNYNSIFGDSFGYPYRTW